MKVYITKFALVKGVFTEEVEYCSYNKLLVSYWDKNHCSHYYRKPDWHKTKESAITHVNDMISKRKVSLQKQMKRLDGITGENIVNSSEVKDVF